MTTAVVGDELARIRTIKPEFWSSPGHRGLDPWARLLFVAMWNWADDYGRGTASPKELAGFAFPEDEEISSADVRRMLGEIRRAFDVEFYEVGGRPYFWIPSWDKHQKIDKRSNAKYPAPEDGVPWNPDPTSPVETAPELRKQHLSEKPAEVSVDPAGPSAESAGSSALEIGTGEIGNRNRGNRSTSVLPVGQLTDRNAHTREAPPAQPEDHFVARSVIATIPRYRTAPGWVRKRLAPLIGASLDAGFGPDAIKHYAEMTAAEGRFLDLQHIPEARDALRRLGRDVALSAACQQCGGTPTRCPCVTAALNSGDRPWSDEDQAALEAALARLDPTPDELALEA